MLRVWLPLLLVACAADDPLDELQPNGAVGKGDGFCPMVDANIFPDPAPPYACGPLDSFNDGLVADINRFWGSNIVGCACQSDFPGSCDGAYSFANYGYLYVGPAFIEGLREAGSLMPIQYMFAHEIGHEIQGHYNALPTLDQPRELMADCLAGYYLGSLVCRGQVTEEDIAKTLSIACIIGDGTGDPVKDLKSHGTCPQRVASVATGMRAYLSGAAPLAACAL